MEKFSILFACIGNSCRSQMAEGIAKHLSKGKASIQSAGTKPEEKVTPFAVQVMKELGIDISHQKPKLITVDMLRVSTHFISMGRGVQESCPVPIGVPNVEDWDLEDPWGKDIQFFRKTRDNIKEKVEHLLKKLLD
ncbi:arsenate reductase ArsC [Promethearchaeum syntrophicum]|uniref:Arsenate reductase ArsC n=1 Tax=Promethearchaeum syntrophicum TaxID=2594042 RepID=A0A5B9D9F2_9ARCH|nr:arsenate reductase ArsC [Candidatus Prometheoarchaeum syntrophicum]QEE15615.1 Protein ArsC [Candidatus Prometheoarchaeum syntrophicum]